MGGGFSPPEQRLTEPMNTKRAVGWPSPRGSDLTPMGSAGVGQLNGWTKPGTSGRTCTPKEGVLRLGVVTWSSKPVMVHGDGHFIHND